MSPTSLFAVQYTFSLLLSALVAKLVYPLGGNWYIAAYYVPALAVVHWLIFARLLAAESSAVEASTARLQGGVR